MAYGPGDVFAGYTIVRLLGKGGMGSVYLAEHPRLPRRDALKLLSGPLSEDETYRSRFEREADLAARLSHRNIVAVYDRGAEDDRLWIAMQYVDGIDAAQAIRRGAMHARRAAHIVGEVAAGLYLAHRFDMVHRDVKPANILLQQGIDADEPENVLLADFGIARLGSSSATLTGAGNFMGTLSYAAPEVLNGAPADHRVDIYSLGCVLFELLTGRVPFPVTTPLAAINAHLTAPPPKPSTVAFGVPAALDAVVARAMAKDPADRFQSCRDMSVATRAAVYIDRNAAPAPAEVERDETSDATGRPRPPYTITVTRYFENGEVARLGPVDTGTVSSAERGALETMLRAAGFFGLPLRLPLLRKVPGDLFTELSVAGAGHDRTVGFEREGSRHPAELVSIIERLEQMARWRSVADAGRALTQPTPVRASAPTVQGPSAWVPPPATAGYPLDRAQRPPSSAPRPPAAPPPAVHAVQHPIPGPHHPGPATLPPGVPAHAAYPTGGPHAVSVGPVSGPTAAWTSPPADPGQTLHPALVTGLGIAALGSIGLLAVNLAAGLVGLLVVGLAVVLAVLLRRG